MKINDTVLKFFALILTIAIVILCIFGCIEGCKLIKANSYEQGYIDACKDFYQGKLKYTLIENNDGTREWKKITENHKKGN